MTAAEPRSGTPAARQLAEEVARAHGMHHWPEGRPLRVRFSSGGLAFILKGQPRALLGVEARLDPTNQEIELRGQRPRPWAVSIADSAELGERLRALRRGWRRLHWSPEDLGVFAAAALWTYVCIPAVLTRGAVSVMPARRTGLRRLRVVAPAGAVTHTPASVLHVGLDGRIVRHDYAALPFGRWAHASQVLSDYRVFGPLALASVRRVTPRLRGWRLPGPTLVWIRIEDVAAGPAERPRP